MPQIKPFGAALYNQEKVGDLSKVVCPPYDIIPPAAQNYYHELHRYNLIRLELGKNVPGENKYSRAKNYFKEWIKNKILIQDAEPCIYFYSQQYSLKGEKKERLGFLSLLRLNEKESPVFSHERTRLEPKADRLRLLRQVRANLSPIFLIFPDKNRIVQRTYMSQVLGKPPFIEITDKEKVTHKLWRIRDPDVLAGMQEGIRKESVFIADGHHRYEVACAYRDLMREKLGEKATGEEGFNYILSYFTNAPAHGLSILPVHRLVRVGPKFNFNGFKLKLADHFDVVEKIRDRQQFFFLMEKGGRTEHVLGMYKDKKFYLLRLKNIRLLNQMMSDKPKEYRSLDVSVLNHLVLKQALGLDIEDKEKIAFSPDADEFIEKADSASGYIAFFLNPVKIQEIISIALSEERMPSKSTYFYPKVVSGLVIHKLE